MNRTVTTALAALVLFSFGCGKPSQEQLVQEQVAAMNEVTSVLNTIDSDASAEAALPRLEKAVNRLAAANERAAKTQPKSTDPSKAMEALNDPKVQQVVRQLMDAGMSMAAAAMKAQAKAPRKAEQIRATIEKASAKHAGGAR